AMTGDPEGARSRFVHIVEHHPLSFYMLLAYGRLSAMDAPGAKAVLEHAVSRDQVSPTATGSQVKTPAPFELPAFTRGVKLLEVGDVDAAKKEFTAAGVVADGVEADVLWKMGALYNQAGWPDLGHAFSRVRLSDHLDHYPEGKWRVYWETAYPR